MARIQQLGRAVVVVAVLAALGGCVSIPQRAWQNGAGMSRSDAYRAMMRGERGFHTARSLYNSMDPRFQQSSVRYPYFGRW